MAKAKATAKKKPAKSSVVSSARKSAPGGRRSQQTTFIIVASVIAVAVIIGGIVAIKRASDDKAKTAAANDAKSIAELTAGVKKIAAAVPDNFPASTVSADSIDIGSASAPVTVQLWIDLQCPACKAYEAQTEETLQKDVVAGDVALQVHPVAILNNMSSTNYSSRAGNAAVCGAEQGKFTAYKNALYAYQPAENSAGLTDKKLILIGVAAGLDKDALTKCVNNSTHADWISNSTNLFTKNGFQYTPTILVNGKQMQEGTLDELTSAIASAKAAASK